MKKYCLFILTLMVVSIGDSLCFKANIGVSPYEALALTFNYMSHIKIGTLTLFVNACMILFQVILSKQLKVKYVLQFFMSLFFGMIVNTIVYQLLGGITLHYYQSLIMEIIGLCISASGCGLLVALNVCVFPCEGFALTFSSRFSKNKTSHRYYPCYIMYKLITYFSMWFCLKRRNHYRSMYLLTNYGICTKKCDKKT